MSKKVILSLIVASALGAFSVAEADVYVRGYRRSNGTYVQPHYRSAPDRSFYNNWSTRPNVNPYTGRYGSRYTPSYRSYRNYYSPNRGSWGW